MPCQLKDVAETSRCEHARSGCLTLQHGIGRDGGAEHKIIDRLGSHVKLRHQGHHAVEDAVGRVGGSGGELMIMVRAWRQLRQHEVSESAAGINADPDVFIRVFSKYPSEGWAYAPCQIHFPTLARLSPFGRADVGSQRQPSITYAQNGVQ